MIAEFFPSVHAIEAPGTLDGGDICEAGRVHFIGLSARTNEAGAFQLARILETEGRRSTIVDIRGKPGILHLKSGIASIGDDRLVAVEARRSRGVRRLREIVRVAGGEEYAANCVRIRDSILVAAGYPPPRRSAVGPRLSDGRAPGVRVPEDERRFELSLPAMVRSAGA